MLEFSTPPLIATEADPDSPTGLELDHDVREIIEVGARRIRKTLRLCSPVGVPRIRRFQISPLGGAVLKAALAELASPKNAPCIARGHAQFQAVRRSDVVDRAV